MEAMAMEVESVHLIVGDFDAFWVCAGVELAADGDAGLRGGGGDQSDDGCLTDQRPSPPDLGDDREEPVLDRRRIRPSRRSRRLATHLQPPPDRAARNPP